MREGAANPVVTQNFVRHVGDSVDLVGGRAIDALHNSEVHAAPKELNSLAGPLASQEPDDHDRDVNQVESLYPAFVGAPAAGVEIVVGAVVQDAWLLLCPVAPGGPEHSCSGPRQEALLLWAVASSRLNEWMLWGWWRGRPSLGVKVVVLAI